MCSAPLAISPKVRPGSVRTAPRLCSNGCLGQRAVDEVKSKTKGGQITLIEMDNESLASVKAAAESFLKQSKTLNVLINNAGVMAVPEGKTKDGFETQFGRSTTLAPPLTELTLADRYKPCSALPPLPTPETHSSRLRHIRLPIPRSRPQLNRPPYSTTPPKRLQLLGTRLLQPLGQLRPIQNRKPLVFQRN